MAIIYHITTLPAWELARATGFVEAESLATEGFIHCSRRHQLLAVAQRFFPGHNGLIVLAIDETKVAAILVNEGPQAAHDPFAIDVFPHLYGRIPVAAVVTWAHLAPNPQGNFSWPTQLPLDATL